MARVPAAERQPAGVVFSGKWFGRAALALANGSVIAVLALAYAVSYAAFIFTGRLSAGVGFGIDAALLAIAVGGLLVWRSGFRFAIVGPDSNPTAVLALAALPIAASSADRAASTLLMGSALATAFTGLLLYVLGRLRAGRVIRFIPYPMIGGFSAASGLLVLLGGVHLLSGRTVTFTDLPVLLVAPHPTQLALGVGFALLLVLVRRPWGPLAVPTAIVAALALSTLVVTVLHLPLDALQHEGWFLVVPQGRLWLPWMASPQSVDWAALVPQLPGLCAIGVIAAVTILVNSTGLEVLSRKDVDFDAELRTAGIGNLLGGFAGAMVSYTSLSRSALNYRLGTRDRSVGGVVVAFALIVLAIGPGTIVSHIPTFVPAALLLSTGASVAIEWMIAARRRLSLGDMLTIWSIVATVVAFGFVAGVTVGMVIGCLTFVVRYGRIEAIEHRLSGATYRSSLQRSERETETLKSYGDHANIYVLRGYIFFGMADRIYREMLQRISEVDGPGWIVIDFSGVTGIDSSVATAFVKLLHNVDGGRVRVLLSGMRGQVARLWNTLLDNDTQALLFDDLDLAMEWCENDLLRQFDSYADLATSFPMWVAEQVGEDLAPTLLSLLEPIALDTGEALCTQGEDGDRMFFIESGRVAVIVGEETPRRVRSLGPQTIVGELGLYRYMPYDASVIAETPTIAHALSRDALDVIEGTDPILATWFHAAIVRTLADRLGYHIALAAAHT
jgi:sulfate permease, SulP family